MKLIAEIINEELRKHSEFTPTDINQHLDFDSDSYLRLLCRRGFLEQIREKGPDGLRYARSAAWPPPDSYFTSGPIGLTYCVQTWFRYYLQQWIEGRMGELEAKEGVYSLDHGFALSAGMLNIPGGASADWNVPDAEGDFTDARGRRWADDSEENGPREVRTLSRPVGSHRGKTTPRH